jgi:aspartyl-tRNA(Asn)/glutamyl-tRNA(Gln) amidotransferase subunit A
VTDAADLTAVELLAAYRARDLSPVEATRAVLDRIRALDQQVNAFCLVDEDGAVATATESQARWQRGEPRGALDGVPVSVKDLLLTVGWPTRRGSRTTDPDAPTDVDAPSVARVREQDAVLIGKTTTPEYGWKGVTDSPLTGVTRNPWDHSRTSGGSSGGSAVAVALGMGPLSLGTDGGGSVRIPAAFSGITTLKPTYGRVPLYPASPFGSLSHVGPMTRTAADAALLLDVLSGFDPRDAWALAPAEPTTPHLDDGVAGLRIAFSPGLGYVDVDPEVAGAAAAAAAVFGELGATVEHADPGFADPIEAFQVLWFSGAAAVLAPLRARRAEMDPGLVEVAEQGAGYSAVDYVEATGVRNEMGALMGDFHARYDLLLTPTMPIPAFAAGEPAPPDWASGRWTSWTPFTFPFNLTQQPAASVPCGFTADGLPIGLQIVGARHADALVLAAAQAFQRATGFHLRSPLRAQEATAG